MSDFDSISPSANPIAELLEDAAWPEGTFDEILRIGAAPACAALVEFIRDRRLARVEDRALLRACRLAGVLRLPAALPLILDLALDTEVSERALWVALRVARSFGPAAGEAVSKRIAESNPERAAPGPRLSVVKSEAERTQFARRLDRELRLLCVLRPLAELDDDDEARFGGPLLYPRERGPGRNAPCPCGSGRKFKLCCG